MGGLGVVGVAMFGRLVVWGGVELVLGGTFGWITVVPGTGSVESKGVRMVMGWFG